MNTKLVGNTVCVQRGATVAMRNIKPAMYKPKSGDTRPEDKKTSARIKAEFSEDSYQPERYR